MAGRPARYGGFALACLTVIAATLAVLWLVYAGAEDRRAILVGAAVAFVVQMVAFSIALTIARTNVMAGWGLGAVIRLVALSVYALAVAPALGLPLSAALVSVALYLFLSTLVEPFFLKP